MSSGSEDEKLKKKAFEENLKRTINEKLNEASLRSFFDTPSITPSLDSHKNLKNSNINIRQMSPKSYLSTDYHDDSLPDGVRGSNPKFFEQAV